jgi:hypothetical protein
MEKLVLSTMHMITTSAQSAINLHHQREKMMKAAFNPKT